MAHQRQQLLLITQHQLLPGAPAQRADGCCSAPLGGICKQVDAEVGRRARDQIQRRQAQKSGRLHLQRASEIASHQAAKRVAEERDVEEGRVRADSLPQQAKHPGGAHVDAVPRALEDGSGEHKGGGVRTACSAGSARRRARTSIAGIRTASE